MHLEDIIKTYGWYDYYEQNTGKTYHLSKAWQVPGTENTFRVPVSIAGITVGYTEVTINGN